MWKPLLLIAPAGLFLGAIGGQMARPVLTQRESDDSLQAMFQTRAERYGLDSSNPTQADSTTPYDGGYSYVPDWVTRANANWSPPGEDAWSYSYAAAPLPTLAQLDARQAALLADPEKEYAVHTPPESDESAAPRQPESAEPNAADGQDDAPATQAPENSPEPRTADGQPAIW